MLRTAFVMLAHLLLVTNIPTAFAFVARPLRPVPQRRQEPFSLQILTETTPGGPSPSRLNSHDGPVLGLTENLGLTYTATGSKCLDLFFDLVPDEQHGRRRILSARGIGELGSRWEEEDNRAITLLEEAWEEDPLTTLKIIFQMGDPRHGKADRKNFYKALLWLYDRHPEVLFLNLKRVPKHTCYKALLDLLLLVLSGSDALDDKRPRYRSQCEKRQQKQDTHAHNLERFYQQLSPELREPYLSSGELQEPKAFMYSRNDNKAFNVTKQVWKDPELRGRFMEMIQDENQDMSAQAKVLRLSRRDAMLRRAENRLNEDAKYAKLYKEVSTFFAQYLKNEHEDYLTQRPLSGLVAKWAPTPGMSHDKHTNICEGIIQRLYENEYKYRDEELRIRFQQEYLGRLRRAACIPESFTGSGEWHLVDYSCMPSRCRLLFGESVYRKHDKERYDNYLDQAKKELETTNRTTMVVSGALLPHEVTTRAEEKARNGKQDVELGLQWLRLVQDCKKSGHLTNALAICDVSGSMSGAPMDVSIALSLLIADICDDSSNWSRKVVTFSQSPNLVALPQASVDNLASRASFVRGIDWGWNTDFQAVFQLLLKDAKRKQLPQAGMPQLLFCFSDMEFDAAMNLRGREWKTDLELMRSKYDAAGYEMPEIVFWNLRESRSKPSCHYEPGVAMLSGFSAGLLKSFLECRLDNFTPLAQMQAALQPYGDLEL